MRSFRMIPRPVFATLVFSFLALMANFALGQDSAQAPRQGSRPVAAVHPSAGKPLANLANPQALKLEYAGSGEALSALQSGRAIPTGLATADFDADGAVDVVAGYSTKPGGILTLLRGNPDAFAPKDPRLFVKAMKGTIASTFLPESKVYELPESPDMILTGDFNRDGYQDVLVGARGGNLYLLAGDGKGSLSDAEMVSLEGKVRAIAVTPDGHVAVSMEGRDGPELRILAPSAEGLVSGKSYTLPARADSVAFGDLGGGWDVAVAAGDKMVTIYSPLTAEPKTETTDLGFKAAALTLGDFIWDREGRTEISVLALDGTIHILRHGTLDSRPLSAADASGRRAALRETRKRQRLNPMSMGPWTVAGQVHNPGAAPAGALSFNAFSSPRLAAASTNDLMVIDGERNELRILDTSGKTVSPSTTVSFAGEPVAALSLPQKIDAHRETIVLVKGETGPVILGQGPDPVYNVTGTADVDDAGACGSSSGVTSGAGPNGKLSLREAICEANNNGAGTYTINVPAGTYQLNLNTFAGGSSGSASGELQVGFISGSNFTISGAGAGSTIIQQTDNVDRVIEQDQLQSGNITLNIQNLTLTGGLCSTGLDCGFSGGALIAGGITGDGASLNNVTVSNNSEQADTPDLGGGNQGGGVSMAGPGFSITNSTFSGNSLTATATDAGVGGGVEFLDDILGGLTVTGSTFTNNTIQASANGAQGAGMSITLNTNGDSASISGSTFTGNSAAGPNAQGGGIFSAGPTTVTNSRITGNTAAGGSGFWEEGSVNSPADGTGTVKNNWWGCNTGPNTSGCDKVTPSGINGDNASVVDTPYLVLTLSASSGSVNPGNTSTLTASINTNSASASGFSVPTGTPVSFGVSPSSLGSDNPTSGTLSGGSATSTFTAGGTPGTGSVTATVDNAISTTSMQVLGTPPSIISVNSTTFIVGTASSFTVTTSANPTATTISELGALPGGVSFVNNGNGTATLSGTPITGTGGTYPFTITASNGVNPAATQNFTLTVSQAPAISSGGGTTFTAGTFGSFTVTASGSPTPTLSEIGPLPTGVNFIDNGNGTATLSGTTSVAGSYPITIQASNGVGSTASQSFTLKVNPGAASHFSVSAPGSATAGASFSATVTALDAFGNTATTYAGTIHFTSSDAGGGTVLPVNFTFSSFNAGVASFSFTLVTAGSQSITATDTVNSAVTGSANVSVSPGALANLSISGPNTVGSNSDVSYLIKALDAFGNTATSFNGTVSLTSSDPGFVPVSGNPVSLTSGVDSSYSLALRTAGTQSVTVTDTANSAISGTILINVLPGAASHLAVSAPATAFSGTSFNFTVTALDVANNIATGYSGTVGFTSIDPSATLPPSSTLTNGSGTFPATLVTSGQQTITATDTVTTTITGTSNPVTVSIPYLVVNTANDDAGAAGNCTVMTAPGSNTVDAACSLRDALANAATLSAPTHISFDATTFASPSTITLTNGTLTVPTLASITGPTSGSGGSLANLVTVSGGGSSSDFPVFTTSANAVGAVIANLAITNGNFTDTGGGAGGIYNGYQAALTVMNSTISANAAPNGVGGIFNDYNATLNVINSTISGNSGGNGAIFNEGGGTVTITGSTISNNSASASGGGIVSAGTALTVTASTISGNSAAFDGGGIFTNFGTTTLANSIVSGNTATTNPDVDAAVTNNGGNLIGGTVALLPLGNYGGPTQTLLPLPGATAICGGIVANATGLSTDQRGFARLTTYSSTPCADSGAVQSSYSSLAFAAASYAGSVNTTLIPPPIVSLLENGQNIGGVPLTLSFAGSGSASGLGPVATVANIGATFNSVQVNSRGSSDTLSVSVPVTGAGSSVGATSLSASAPLAITKGLTVVTLSNGGTNNALVGTSITFTVTVSGSGPAPTGMVYFSILHSFLGQVPLVDGVATLTLNTLPAGDNQISARYLGDPNYQFVDSNVIYQIVTRYRLTSTTFTATPSPATVGHPLSLSFTGTGSGPMPTGTVQFFMDGLVPVGSAPMVNGTATFPATTVPPGNHSFTAQYEGDTNYARTIATTTGSVAKVVSQLVLSSSANPSTFGSNLTITATVTQDPDDPSATGTVYFYLLHTLIGQQPLVNGHASIAQNNLPLGDSQFSAQYVGDVNYTSATSNLLFQLVSRASLNTTFTATPNPVTVNHMLTLTFTGTSTNGTPTGTVQFLMDAQMPIGSSPMIGGVATLPITTVPLGNHTFIAKYSGDSNFLPTQSTTTGSVARVVSQVTLTGPGVAVALNANASYTLTVTQDSANVPATGTVNLFSLHTLIGQGTLVNGQVVITVTFAQAGEKQLVAQYLGDGTYNPGTSNFLYQNVQ